MTGTSSGLGGGLKRILGAVPINRTNLDSYKNQKFDTLIHAGFERYDKTREPFKYQRDAVNLAKFLLDLNYNKFVFISTVECNNTEDTTPYVKAKRLIERLVSSSSGNYQILRLPSLYGMEMKRNQIYQIATEHKPSLTLSSNSTFSLIQYEDVAKIIKNTQSLETQQIFSECLTLREIAKYFRKTPIWGKYDYKTKIPDGVQPIFSKTTSLKKYKKFIEIKNDREKN